jgi:hypothetical protein
MIHHDLERFEEDLLLLLWLLATECYIMREGL